MSLSEWNTLKYYMLVNEYDPTSGEPRDAYYHRMRKEWATERLNEIEHLGYDEDPRTLTTALCEVIRTLHYL